MINYGLINSSSSVRFWTLKTLNSQYLTVQTGLRMSNEQMACHVNWKKRLTENSFTCFNFLNLCPSLMEPRGQRVRRIVVSVDYFK